MRYKVFENDLPASTEGYPDMHPSWNNCIFNTKEDAEHYVAHWCYPVGLEKAKELAIRMEINRVYNMGAFGGAKMCIREVT